MEGSDSLLGLGSSLTSFETGLDVAVLSVARTLPLLDRFSFSVESTEVGFDFSSRGGRHEEAHPSNEPSIYGRETLLFKASPASTHPSARSNAPPSAASGLHSARDRFRKMQNGPPPSSSPFRLQIGNSGMKNDNRKVMPESNSRLRHGNERCNPPWLVEPHWRRNCGWCTIIIVAVSTAYNSMCD